MIKQRYHYECVNDVTLSMNCVTHPKTKRPIFAKRKINHKIKNSTMKKITMYLLTALLSLSFIPATLKADAVTVPVSMTAAMPVESVESNILIGRLNEIKAMDMSNMSREEKKQLRKEVLSTKKQLRESHGGIYLSVGAIIIIILLLILLL
jgi:hypothetical protein